ncbi:MAG: nuclear transport factor 2 family protein [Bacteroidota bacterium]
MKNILVSFLFSLLFVLGHDISCAQENMESIIRNLENTEGQAWVNKDSVELFKLFSPQLVVNTPLNKVVTLDVLKKLMRTGKIDISSSEKVIEKITFIKDMAVVMGHDIVKPQGLMDNAGKTVTRQYTDIWIKDESGWHLTIRQATIISII